MRGSGLKVLLAGVLQAAGLRADGLPGRAHQPVVVALRVGLVARALDQRDAADLVARAFARAPRS